MYPQLSQVSGAVNQECSKDPFDQKAAVAKKMHCRRHT
jgi:hypothetical protein